MKTFSIHQIRSVFAIAIIGGLFSVTYFTSPSFFKASKVEAGTSQNVSGYAWSENIGWISFNDTNEITPYTGASYGVNVDTSTKSVGGTGVFSGYAWVGDSDVANGYNTGWISFNSADLTGCPSGSCVAQVDWSTGKVTGWARALSGKNDPQAGGWDGWIKLSKGTGDTGPAYGVTISGNKFSGYAWGGADGAGVAGVVGWIDFGPTVSGVPIGVQVSAPPCTTATVTSWGSCQPLTQCTGGGTQSGVAGIRVGLCSSGGTVTQGCTIATQTCTATSSASTKIKYRQF